jgi:hypothetical protein
VVEVVAGMVVCTVCFPTTPLLRTLPSSFSLWVSSLTAVRSMTGDDVLDLRFGLAAVVRLIILGMTKGGKAMLSTWAVTNGS